MESTPHGRLPCGGAPLFGGGLARRCSRPREHSARRRRAALGVCCISSRAACLLCGCGHEGEWPANVVCAASPAGVRFNFPPTEKKGRACACVAARGLHNGRAPRFRLLLPPSTVRPSAWPPAAQRRPPPHCVRSSVPAQERDPGMGEATRFLLLWEARGHFWAAAIFLSLSTAWGVSRTDVSAPSVKRRAAARCVLPSPAAESVCCLCRRGWQREQRCVCVVVVVGHAFRPASHPSSSSPRPPPRPPPPCSPPEPLRHRTDAPPLRLRACLPPAGRRAWQGFARGNTTCGQGGEALQATSSDVDMILRAATTPSLPPTSWAARTAVFGRVGDAPRRFWTRLTMCSNFDFFQFCTSPTISLEEVKDEAPARAWRARRCAPLSE